MAMVQAQGFGFQDTSRKQASKDNMKDRKSMYASGTKAPKKEEQTFPRFLPIGLRLLAVLPAPLTFLRKGS